MEKTALAYIGLGTNLGDRKKNIREALRRISEIAQITAQSSLYSSPPWGFDAEQDFLNAVISIRTTHDPKSLLRQLRAIELDMGRAKKAGSVYESRIIDLDILDYEGKIVKTVNLELPHPHLHERKFVLVPLLEIAPQWIHPVFNENLIGLLNQCRDGDSIENSGPVGA